MNADAATATNIEAKIMISSRRKYSLAFRSPLLAVTFALLAGCGDSSGDKPEKKVPDSADMKVPDTQLDSANYYLSVTDLAKFRPGRSRAEILKDLHWRVASVAMAECNGKAVSAMTYDLLSDGPQNGREVWLHAIFENDKFVKLIHWLPGEMEEVPYEGTTWSRPKPMKIGDNQWLIRALEAMPVSIEGIRKEVEAASTPPKHTDIGLTIAWLLLRPALQGQAPNVEDFQTNAALRDQFNAARLHIGMTESEVEAVIKTKPLESGMVEAGFYSIYGSCESVHVADVWLHFSNILVVFRGGKASAVYSFGAGDEWRRKLGEAFVDLPVM